MRKLSQQTHKDELITNFQQQISQQKDDLKSLEQQDTEQKKVIEQLNKQLAEQTSLVIQQGRTNKYRNWAIILLSFLLTMLIGLLATNSWTDLL